MPRFTLSLGLHYVRDTGRVDSDLGPLPALNMWGTGLGDQVRTPGDNFRASSGLCLGSERHRKDRDPRRRRFVL
jgi:hypothetical protein